MLATNVEEHNKLLANRENPNFWDDAFNDPNEFKKIYKQEIIYDLIEKENVDDIRRVRWINGYDKNKDIEPRSLHSIHTEKFKKDEWADKFL